MPAWYEQIPAAPRDPMSRQQAWLDHVATDEQLDFFRQNGYLVVEDALSLKQVARLNVIADRVAEQARHAHGLKPYKDVSTLRCIMEDPEMLELLDNPTTFPILWDVLGWNIQVGQPPSLQVQLLTFLS